MIPTSYENTLQNKYSNCMWISRKKLYSYFL